MVRFEIDVPQLRVAKGNVYRRTFVQADGTFEETADAFQKFLADNQHIRRLKNDE